MGIHFVSMFRPNVSGTQLLFGTPHFGSNPEQVRAIAERFAPMAQTAKKPKFAGLTEAIIAHSNDLKEISEDFRTLASRYSITSWYETECWPGTDRLIVDILSARMVITDEKQLSVAADHLAMCQFEDAADETFQEVCESIRSAIETGYRGPNRVDSSIEITSVDPRTVADTSNRERGSQDVASVQQTQETRSTHTTTNGVKARKIVIKAVEVEYEDSSSMDDLIRMLKGTGRNALGHEPVLLLEEADDAKDQLPWTEEATVATQKAATIKRMNRAANITGALRWFRPRMS
jgi:hypothetical protein